ncbi:hypothetical protein F3Y22_tig00110201pilonHSYRG00292 [Hibiscus syriacus]|uniref:Reverse transcriptase zinc-binding domain-containing protein n=1 Tax=Hibiscus syriacus TaxID=106335 RepID=A0A6A3BDV7_HIBSY|nr:hypothetical protein F3Y22_tig00110201pilonHSYRG00292 [Hibiscus syriacus]
MSFCLLFIKIRFNYLQIHQFSLKKIKEVSDLEIKEALFIQGKDKSPGPDGFTYGFFKAAWNIVDKDFISANQTTFVKGKNIVENTLLAQEVVKGYSRKSLSPRCSIKIDLQKVFDSVNWDFLLAILEAMGLPDKFRIKLNVSKTEFFACGLNQIILDQIRLATGFRMAHLPVRLVIPKGVIKDVERLCMRFFWKGCDTSARGARVGWGQICSLKSEGGLGLKDLALWSKSCCLLLIRNILATEGSLWIAWLQAYCFKSESYWEVGCKPHYSWILNKLLRLRDDASILFSPGANLSLIKSKWIWDNIRISREKASWHKIIWFPSHILKFSLISWMAILDRLPTRDRLLRFGVVNDDACVICGSGMESHDHLFADYLYARNVWNAVLGLCGFRSIADSWDQRLNWLVVNPKGYSGAFRDQVRILKKN